MNIPKLIVTDLDGTALNDDKSISPRTRAAFKACHDNNIKIAIATARYITGAMPFAKTLFADYMILTDGTLIYDTSGNLINSNTMPSTTTNLILKELKKNGYLSHIAIPTPDGLYRYPAPSDANLYNPATDYTPGVAFDINSDFSEPACKIVAEFDDSSEAIRIAKLCDCSQFRYSGENRFTFYSKNASKKNAIHTLARHIGISSKDILAFGDDINDIEMITFCGTGVAVANAIPAVKAAADYITLSNTDDGVADFLEKLL